MTEPERVAPAPTSNEKPARIVSDLRQFRTLLREDLERATKMLPLIASQDPNVDIGPYLGALWNELSLLSAGDRIDWAKDLDPQLPFTDLLLSQFIEYSSDDLGPELPELVSILESRSDGGLADAIILVAGRLAIEDPAQALVWSTSLKGESNQEQGITHTFRLWANRHPEEVLDFFSYGIESIDSHNDIARSAVGEMLASKLPSQSLEILSGIREENLKDNLMADAFVTWHANEPEAAIAWLRDNQSFNKTLSSLSEFTKPGDG